jgi:hypothetical protein
VQIWLIPDAAGGNPTYAQQSLPSGNVLLAGPKNSGALLGLRSATTVSLVRAAEANQTMLTTIGERRFVHLLDGLAFAETERLASGDGLQIPSDESTTLDWASDGAALIFTMP